MAAPVVLGRYELYDPIAAGGMATVHFGRVRGAAEFARFVAIKRLHAHFAQNATFVKMLVDEARVVARIRHPNVVPIVDVVHEGGEMFLVMEYVHGESLDGLLHHPDDAAAPVPIAVAIFADVLHGLHAAHEATAASGEPLDVVHRDVTPHNVLVGADGSARIADFGIAKASSRLQDRTKTGVLKGKLSYLAPEQLEGETSRAIDIYAASASLFEALTGRVLFDGETEGEVLRRILLGPTNPPSALAPGIPPELDEIVMRGLEMKPQRRFATAREMALALERVTERPPPSVIAAWVESRAGERLRARSETLARIERAPPAASPSPSPSPPSPSPPPPAPTESSDPVIVPGMPSRRPIAAVAIGLAVCVVVGVGLVGWRRARPDAPPATVAAPTSPAASAPGAPPSSPAPEGVAPSAAASPPTTASALTPHAPPHAGAAPPRAAASSCNPPYVRDETGRKLYKRECL